jgi:outer membrane lipoprotein
MKHLLPLTLVSLALFSCTYAISNDIRKGHLRSVSFKSVRENPDKYTGSVFIWGGFIAGIKGIDNGTLMEVVQNPVDRYGFIVDTDISGGRFLASTTDELDPLIYERGRLVTVAGRLAGTREVSREEKTYVYPFIEIMEIYLWKEDPVTYTDLWRGDHYPYSYRQFPYCKFPGSCPSCY